MIKHYCTKCGKELKFTEETLQKGFNVNTGKPIMEKLFTWRCPSYRETVSSAEEKGHLFLQSDTRDFNSAFRFSIVRQHLINIVKQ